MFFVEFVLYKHLCYNDLTALQFRRSEGNSVTKSHKSWDTEKES